jgi:hypothetical protein
MPIGKVARENGSHLSDDLQDFLTSVFVDVQKSQLVEAAESDALARYIFEVYDSGIRDRGLLIRTVTNNFTRPTLPSDRR